MRLFKYPCYSARKKEINYAHICRVNMLCYDMLCYVMLYCLKKERKKEINYPWYTG